MPLHPQVKAIFEQMAAQGAKPVEQMTPAEARAERARTAQSRAALAAPFEEMVRVEDSAIPGPGGPIPVRIYCPETGNRLPALVYFHGRGWVFRHLHSECPF